MDTALVTGGAGFIGSHLVAALLADGWRVRTCGRRARPPHLPPEVHYVRVDLAGEEPLDPLVDGVSHVFHLAGASSSFASQEEMERTNVVGAENLLKAALDSPTVARVVHFSSTSVYGEKEQLPLPVVEDAPLKPSRGYGRTKAMTEEVVWRMCEKGLPCVILRPVTVYGPGNRKLLASAILDVAIERYAGLRTIEVPRTPVRLRLVHVADLVRASLHLARREDSIGQVYNVTSGIYPTSLEVAIDIAYSLGVSLRLSDDEDCGLSLEERRWYRQRMIEERGMRPQVVLSEERLRFLRKANRNNELSIDKLLGTGFRFRHTDLRRCTSAQIEWLLEHGWVV